MKVWMMVLLCATVGGCAMSARQTPPANVTSGQPASAQTQDIAGLSQMLHWPMAAEIWVIQREAILVTPSPAPSPVMYVESGGRSTQALPLLGADVNIAINGFIARTDVVQHFGNRLAESTDATYEFRLPQDAAVHDFVITIGKRQIRAVIRSREEAQHIYVQALKQGYTASLIGQDESGTIRQKIANVTPGVPIDVTLNCFSTLQYRDGWFEYALPLVAYDHSAMALKARVDEGMGIGEIRSLSDAVDVKRISANVVQVELGKPVPEIRRDFNLQFNLAQKQAEPMVMLEKAGDGGYLAVMMPPVAGEATARKPLDVNIVIDAVTGMRGDKLELAKEIARQTIQRLGPDDRVRIISVGKSVEINAGSDAKSALEFAEHLHADGLTPLADGIARAAALPADMQRQKVVIVATDGASLDGAALAAGRSLHAGVGIACTTDCLYGQALARCCRGVFVTLENGQQAGEFVNRLLEESGKPGMANIATDSPGVSEACAVGMGMRPGFLAARFTGPIPAELHVSAIVDGKQRFWTVTPVVIDPIDRGPAGVECIWAKMRITELADRYLQTQDAQMLQQIRQIALDHSVVSPMTSLLMVDAMKQ